ncbi:MAG: hypothetical protein RIR39_2763, partial [Pseudomonadota bacterium]
MSNRQQPTAFKSAEKFFRLKPLVAGVRIVIAGGLFVGSGVATAYEPLPIPSFNPITAGHAPVPIIAQAINGQATAAINGHAMTINQITDRATIDWKSFDVDKGYSVKFVQPSSSSVALNKIHQADPSVILGTVTANGQIYLVNQNGFIFGKGSVIDANTLVASALNISDDAIKTGIIRVFDNNVNAQKMEDRAALNGNTNDPNTAVKLNAKINVAAGAKIHAAKNGSVILAAPTVENSGSVTTDEQGQILMVASQDAVYLQPTSGKDPFAGLLVEVGKGGQVTNQTTGNISARQGNVTLAGFAVNQSGRVSATTSVNANGSVRLLARENAQVTVDRGASYLTAAQTVRSADLKDGLGKESKVTLGKNSSINVLPDINGGSAIDEQAQKQSVVEVTADKIHLQSGSSIVATSGEVNLKATDNLVDPLSGKTGRIDLEKGSSIDVSGTKNVKVAMERNVADVSVQTFNLRDAPYQRGGVLKGKTVKVDIRNLPSIVDASSASASIKKGIDERLGAGGTINLTSSGDVVVNDGAVADISGGSVSYQDGYINTTKLLSATGRIVDISKANPNEQFSSIFGLVNEDHVKWGVSTEWNMLDQLSAGQFEKGYTEGKAGGAVNIQSPLTAWNGQLVAGVVSGINQRNRPVSGGSFILNNQDNDTGARAGAFLSSQNVLFQNTQPLLTINIDDPFPADVNHKASDLVLSNSLINQSGISNLGIKTSGTVTLEKDAALSMPALSQFTVDSSKINIDGSLHTAGGRIALKSINTGSSDTGQVNLLTSSLLDVSGRWLNDFHDGVSAELNQAVVIDGGSVSINSDRDMNFNSGATIKTDGGARLGVTGNQFDVGKAGSINLVAGSSSIKGLMHLDGNFSAFGLGKGGDLSLTANKINIGTKVNEVNALNIGVTNGSLDIGSNSGFSSVNLIS